MQGIKYVFPTAYLSTGESLWFLNIKADGCSFSDTCSYNLPSLAEGAGRVNALIDHEKALLADPTQVYLGGFSLGSEMAAYMQIAYLDYALAGVMCMGGYPIPPLGNMDGQTLSDAQAAATYYGSDMNWFIWHGDQDAAFPVTETMTAYDGMFEALQIESVNTYRHVQVDGAHAVYEGQIEDLVKFVKGQTDYYLNMEGSNTYAESCAASG